VTPSNLRGLGGFRQSARSTPAHGGTLFDNSLPAAYGSSLSVDIMHTPGTSRHLRHLQCHNAIAQIDVGQVVGLSDRKFHTAYVHI
jgi:hypothetical protein